MYDKFGEFDSAEEINRAAAAQKNEGDEEAVKEICKENGIDPEEAEDYMDGVIDELTTPLSAAIGKINVEQNHLKLGGILIDWADELRAECTTNSELSAAVRRKGKSLAGYIASLAEEGYKNRAVVHREIVDLAPECKKVVGSHEFAIGVPDKATRYNLMQQYYLG